SNASSATFRFTSDDPAATFQCTVDHDTPVACTSPFTRILGHGPHAFSVRAGDAAGNTDDSPAEHQWVIDTVAPETTITKAPAPKDNTDKRRNKFTSDDQNAPSQG